MAKRNNTVSFKGLLDVERGIITEETKEGVFVYSILEALREFDGRETSFTLKEDVPVKPLDIEDSEE